MFARLLAACFFVPVSVALAGQSVPHSASQPAARPLARAAVQPAVQAAAAAAVPSPSSAELAAPALERRVNELLQQMTLAEKIGQLVQYPGTEARPAKGTQAQSSTAALNVNPPGPGGIDSYALAQKGLVGSLLNTVGQDRTNHFQHAAVDSSRLHIPLLFGADVVHGYRTIFPVPLATASSWDPAMITEMAHTAAVEARSAGVNWFYSPMVDIARDPRWGRCTEGAGEDPYLGSAIARAYIRGYQGTSLAEPTSVAASVKHFAAYGAAEAGREYNTTEIGEPLLREVYLPPYHAAVQAGAATVMTAFNALNGVPASANPFLLQTILRDEWGFNGATVSDYTAVMELVNHGVALDAAQATQKALTAGVDIDMNAHFYDVELPALLKSGKVPMAVVDEAVRRVLRVKFALGLFERPFATGAEVTAAVPEHRPIARRAAQESFVLLKNDPVAGKPLLPLATTPGLKIALIGPLADDDHDMVGAWSGANNFSDVRTLRQTLEETAKGNGQTLTYVQGTEIHGTSDSGFAQAVQAARDADVVLLTLGESSDMSGEAASRAHLDLPGNQQQLMEAVQATGKPVALLVFSGRPLVLTWAAEHLPAMLQVWFPGVETGPAITETLYGQTPPSGKLTMSFPRAEGQEPLYYNQLPTGRPIQLPDPAHPNAYVEKKYVSRYLDESNEPLFPFGHGLTYTTFSYKDVVASARDGKAAKTVRIAEVHPATGQEVPLTVSATVTNTGSRAATEVVQLYLNVRGTSTSQPVRALKGFRRVTLEPGASQTVTFPLGFEELAIYNAQGKQVVEPGTAYKVWVGGSSTAGLGVGFSVVP